jgi:hypothetical protein
MLPGIIFTAVTKIISQRTKFLNKKLIFYCRIKIFRLKSNRQNCSTMASRITLVDQKRRQCHRGVPTVAAQPEQAIPAFDADVVLIWPPIAGNAAVRQRGIKMVEQTRSEVIALGRTGVRRVKRRFHAGRVGQRPMTLREPQTAHGRSSSSSGSQ